MFAIQRRRRKDALALALDLPIVHATGMATWRFDGGTVDVAIVVFGERHGAGLSLGIDSHPLGLLYHVGLPGS